MAYTTQVHVYTLKVPNRGGFNNFQVCSVKPLDMENFLKNRANCIVEDNGMVEATQVFTTHSPWNTILYGYKQIHTSRDSRGCYNHDVNVPCDWDENHPIVQKIKGISKGEAHNQDRYYSQLWV